MLRKLLLAFALLVTPAAAQQIVIGGGGSSTTPVTPPPATSVVAGAVGNWHGYQYAATGYHPCLPNSAASTPCSQNIVSAPRNLFSSSLYWGTSGSPTITDGQAANDGSNNASNVVCAANTDCYISPAVNNYIPNTVYSVWLDIESTDGTTPQVRMGPNASMTTKTLTTSWATYNVVFTPTSANPALIILRSLNATSAALNLRIDNARICVGSSDCGADTLAGNMVFGATSQSTALIPSQNPKGIIDFSATGGGVAQFNSPLTLTSFTATSVCARAGAPLAQPQTWLSRFGSTYTQFAIEHFSTYFQPEVYIAGTYYNQNQQNTTTPPGLFPGQRAGEYDVVTVRYDGTTISWFVDDVLVNTFKPGTANLTPTPTSNFAVSWSNGSFSLYSKMSCAAFLLYNTALTDAQVRQNVAYEQYDLYQNAPNITVSPVKKWLFVDGDSITFGSNSSAYYISPYTNTVQTTGSYASLIGLDSSPPILGEIAAASSAVLGTSTDANTVNSLWGRKDRACAFIPPSKNGRLFAASILIGRNDLIGYSGGASGYASAVAAYAGYLKTTCGFDRVVLNTLISSTGTGFNTARNSFNAIVSAAGWGASNNVDLVCRFDQDPNVGSDSSSSNTFYFSSDGTHPSNYGYESLERNEYKACINGLN